MNHNPGATDLTEAGREMEQLLHRARSLPGVADALELQERISQIATASQSQFAMQHSVTVANFTPGDQP